MLCHNDIVKYEHLYYRVEHNESYPYPIIIKRIETFRSKFLSLPKRNIKMINLVVGLYDINGKLIENITEKFKNQNAIIRIQRLIKIFLRRKQWSFVMDELLALPGAQHYLEAHARWDSAIHFSSVIRPETFFDVLARSAK